MVKSSPMLYKSLVIGIILLFIGVAVQPGIATVQPEEEINVEPKDYLFQTIIDIANNPDVKSLLEQYTHNLFTSDYDYKGVFSKLILRNPRLLFSMLFTKPYITYDYLDKSYNRGIEITNILGEDKALKIVESIEITNPEFFGELNNIIMNNDELSNRLTILEELNKEYISDLSWDFPIICDILYKICIYTLMTLDFFMVLLYIFENNLIITTIIETLGAIIGLTGFFSFLLSYGLLDCPQWESWFP